ncbi:MAG: PKD domain-containing protein [Sphingobacteriales bacterium]|nr:PKD domain-containing protein [Sphingobacteriales bacterium]OJY84419.1 MAG: hypothetical protein BGP14_19440 [Sphingobacteriales bacterium 44-15]
MKIRTFYTLLLALLSFSTHAQTPVADFSASVVSGCAPLRVSFRDLSTNTPKYWDWDFGNGQLSNLQNPAATFSQPGTYSITLVVRNASGVDGETKSAYITVFPSPLITFSANALVACIPSAIQFTGNATTTEGTISGWKWDFGDGSTSGDQNPSHTYTDRGYYNVSLTATSSNGCTGSKNVPRYIRMVDGIEAEFSFQPPAECKAPFNVPFTNESSGPGTLTYSWDFGNGNAASERDPANIYTAAGNYTVKLTAQSSYGCKDTVSHTVPVTAYTTAFNAPDSVCINEQITFQNTSSPGVTSTLWDFGDGSQTGETSPVKSYDVANSYTVKLINTYPNCSDSVSRIVKIIKTLVDFTATNNTGCGAPLAVDFQSTTAGATSWEWDFGDGSTSGQQNPQHTYANTGKYDVKLTVTNALGCTFSTTKTGFVNITPPTIKISNLPSGGCVPLAISPVASASSPDGIASYSWDFGDGSPVATGTSPTHTYTTPGVYTLVLTVSSNGGCTQPVTRVVRVGTVPTAVDFDAAPSGPCASDTVKFTALTTGANEWLWDFGDGEVSTLKDPHHIYVDTGYLNVTLIARNNGCAAAPVVKNGFIYKAPPVAAFGTNVSCSNRLSVTFSDSSLVDPALGAPVYSWDFGDGTASSTASPGLHTYAQSGEYTVTLTVTNGACSSTAVRTIYLDPLSGGFTASKTTLCLNEQLTLDAVEDTTNIASYYWTAGSNSFSGEKSWDTAFATGGSYNITLLVTDKYNCTATSTQTIIATQPVAQFTPDITGICGSNAVTFSDQSTSGVGIANWKWDFGDGNIQDYTAGPFIHQYADTGAFTVKLVVTDIAGCTDSYVYSRPIVATATKAAFGTPDIKSCPGAEVHLLDSSVGNKLEYSWDLGNGHTSSDQNPVITYDAGLYTVKLVVKDSIGCIDSLIRTGYIDVKAPVAAFDIEDTSSICGLLNTSFYAKISDYESFYWDFGDSTAQSRLPAPKHVYDTYGSYTAKLYVTGYGGCVDSASHQVNVYNPNSETSIDYNVPPFACNELPVEFTIKTPPGTTFQFIYNDGTADSSGQTVLNHTYSYPNNYRPSVVLTDVQDCQVTVNGTKIIAIKGPVPAFNTDTRAFCDSGTVFLTNFTIALPTDTVVSQVWDFGDGHTSTDKQPPPHGFTTPDSYIITLTATTQSTCVQTFRDTVRVFRTPVPVISASDLTCANRMTDFKGTLQQPDTAITWSWNFGDGRTSAEQNNTIAYDKAATYLVSLTAANKLGCKNTDTFSVNVAPLPVITFENPVIPVGGSTPIPVYYSGGITGYNWSPPDGLSCADCPVPTATPVKTTIYTVNVTDSNTCTASARITVEVRCQAENYFVPNTFSPNGDGANDIFYPRGSGVASVQSMRIYNRWGQMIFSRRNFTANDPSKGWDGRIGSSPALPDVYVYVVEFVCENSQVVTLKGNVTLIR